MGSVMRTFCYPECKFGQILRLDDRSYILLCRVLSLLKRVDYDTVMQLVLPRITRGSSLQPIMSQKITVREFEVNHMNFDEF